MSQQLHAMYRTCIEALRLQSPQFIFATLSCDPRAREYKFLANPILHCHLQVYVSIQFFLYKCQLRYRSNRCDNLASSIADLEA